MTYKLASYIAALKPSATEEMDNAVKWMRRAGIDDIISLGVGEPCFDTPTNIVRAAQAALDGGMTKYQPTLGAYELRELISAKLEQENRVTAGIDNVMVTPGAKFGIFLACQALLEPGDTVLITEPAWVSHSCIPSIFGANVVCLDCPEQNGFQPDIEQVKAALDRSVKLIIVNSPCNPTGAVYDKSVIRSIVEAARDNGSLVLSDEIYERLIYEGEPYSPASEYDNVITVNGFSKTYAMTGWRLGYVTAPREIIAGMIKIYQHSASCVTAFAQAGAIEALRSEESERAVRAMVTKYNRKRRLMMALLERSEFFRCNVAQGAFYCFPSYEFSKGSVELAKEFLEQAHVATIPGIAFGDSAERHLRLSYAVGDDDIVEAFERIENYLKGHV